VEISIINGSPRKNGATGKLLQEIGRSLSVEYGATINYYNLSEMRIDYCKGCEVCYQTGKCCIKTDDFEGIADKIKTSDGVVIGSPTHGSNVSAYLKNFMDRGHFIVEQSLYNKSCFSLVTYEIADGRSVIKLLKKFFRVSGGTVKGSLLVKTAFNQNPLNERQIAKRLNNQVKTYHASIATRKGKSLFEHIFNDVIVVNLIWKRYFKKHPEQYKGIIKSYQDKTIHARLSRLQ
jgi:multimeric flavodoxin WrbA